MQGSIPEWNCGKGKKSQKNKKSAILNYPQSFLNSKKGQNYQKKATIKKRRSKSCGAWHGKGEWGETEKNKKTPFSIFSNGTVSRRTLKIKTNQNIKV